MSLTLREQAALDRAYKKNQPPEPSQPSRTSAPGEATYEAGQEATYDGQEGEKK